jgi:hypothetical protein
MRAETSAPNFWAVSPAQTAACDKAVLVDCNTVVARPGSVCIAMADVLGSGMLPFWIFRCTLNAESCDEEEQTISYRLRERQCSSVSEAGTNLG